METDVLAQTTTDGIIKWQRGTPPATATKTTMMAAMMKKYLILAVNTAAWIVMKVQTATLSSPVARLQPLLQRQPLPQPL
jgi:hypothetical protein